MQKSCYARTLLGVSDTVQLPEHEHRGPMHPLHPYLAGKLNEHNERRLRRTAETARLVAAGEPSRPKRRTWLRRLSPRRPASLDTVLATVLFTDIVDSTELASRLGDRAWRSILDKHDVVARRTVHAHGGRMVKLTGDGTMAEFDLPSRAVLCATRLCRQLRDLGVEVRAGIHTGEVERRRGDLNGIGVHIAARITQMADGRHVIVSSTVKELATGSGLRFEPWGTHKLRGLQGDWSLFRIPATH